MIDTDGHVEHISMRQIIVQMCSGSLRLEVYLVYAFM